MPTKTQTTPSMPMNLHIDTDRNGHVQRRGRSRKQSASLVSSPYPVISRAAYMQLTRGGEVVPDELASLRMRRLAMGRQALGNCLTVLQNGMHDHRPEQPGLEAGQVEEYARVWQALRAAYEAVEKQYVGFPLEVRG